MSQSKDISDLVTKAMLGDVSAQFTLAGVYENGIGIDQDYGLAAKWFLKAANSGSPEAQSHIGELYLHGHGVDEDYEKAIFWFRQAAEQNDSDGLAGL